MEPMGIERHRWASRKADVSGSERVKTRPSGSARVDDIKVTAGRDSRADEARQKILKVGELIRLSRKTKPVTHWPRCAERHSPCAHQRRDRRLGEQFKEMKVSFLWLVAVLRRPLFDEGNDISGQAERAKRGHHLSQFAETGVEIYSKS
jgi:hypothetical protein